MDTEIQSTQQTTEESEKTGSKPYFYQLRQSTSSIDISFQNLSLKEKDEFNNYLNIITKQCYSKNYKEVLISTVKLRTFLLQQPIPIIETGVLSRLITFLNCYEFPQLQYESAIILRIVCSTQQVKDLVGLGIIPIFIKLSNYQVKDIRDQVIWGLGNIAIQDYYRDIVLKAGALDIVLQLVINNTSNSDTDFQRHIAWLLYCFCKERSDILFEIQQRAFPILYQLIFNSSDIEILIHCCLSLKTMIQGSSIFQQQQQLQEQSLSMSTTTTTTSTTPISNSFIEIVPRLLELLAPAYIDLHCCVKDTLTILGINNFENINVNTSGNVSISRAGDNHKEDGSSIPQFIQ